MNADKINVKLLLFYIGVNRRLSAANISFDFEWKGTHGI